MSDLSVVDSGVAGDSGLTGEASIPVGCSALRAPKSGFCADFEDGRGLGDWSIVAGTDALSYARVEKPSVNSSEGLSLLVSVPDAFGIFRLAHASRNSFPITNDMELSFSLRPEVVSFKNSAGVGIVATVQVRTKYFVAFGLCPTSACFVEYEDLVAPAPVITPLAGNVNMSNWNRVKITVNMSKPEAQVTINGQTLPPIPLGLGAIKPMGTPIESIVRLGLFTQQAGDPKTGFVVRFDDVFYDTMF